jgi:hypothetical protein
LTEQNIIYNPAIRAAQAGCRIGGEEEKREIPRTLLMKMVRMKVNNEGVNLKKYPVTIKMDEDLDCLPLPLIELSHRYNIFLSTIHTPEGG